MKEKYRKSFYNTIIIAIVVIACAVLFAFGYVGKLRGYLENDMSHFLAEISQQASINLNNKIQTDIKKLETIAVHIGKNNNMTDSSIMENLKRELSINQHFQIMGIIMPDGWALTTNGETGNLGGREYFQKALAGKSNISKTVANIFTGEEINLYGVPVYDEASEIIGVLFAGVNKEVFMQSLAVPTFNNQGFSYVVTDKGNIIADNNHVDGVLPSSSIFMLDFGGHFDRRNFEQDLVNGESGSVSYYHDGEKRFLSYIPLDYNNWRLLTIVPYDAVAKRVEDIIELTVYFWIAIIALLAGMFVIISFLHFRRIKEFDRYVYTDDVTGISSWKKFQLDAVELLSNSQHINYALLSLDINNFKSVRDLYGNFHADQLLEDLAEILCRNLGRSEICARYMADIFVILVLYKNDDDITQRIQNVIKETEQTISEPSISLCVGIYKIDDVSLPIATMHDYALMAKAGAKNNYDLAYCFFDNDMHEMITLEKKCECAMEDSLAREHFLVYFQPKYRLCDRKIAGAEALIRWEHPEMGFLSPGLFIPLFEKNGFVTNLDLYVFDVVCKTLKDWINNDIGAKVISINLSRLHLKDVLIADKLKKIVDHYGIPPRLIEIEFTESVMMEYTPIFDEVLKSFHDIGFSVAMDDFGKGYSSLGLLQNLCVDVLKIDRDFFVNDIQSPRTKTIIANIIRLAKDLSIETVSEGIETQEQVDILEELGCDIIQGYFFARPMPAFEFRELLIQEG